MSTAAVKHIVCLANSRKMSGRCVAGKELLDDGRIGNWIRPVSARESQEVSEWERQYEDGSDPSILDVIAVSLLNPQPKDYQRENWLLDPEDYWEKIRTISSNELAGFTDLVAPLWVNDDSTYNGQNDRVPLSVASSLDSSLRFIKVDRMELSVSQPGIHFGNNKRSVQGRFQYDGVDYWLRVTDPIYERQYLKKPDGDYQIGEAFLTISLGEPYKGYSYKLIAAIIQP